MNLNKSFFVLVLLIVLILGISYVSAENLGENITSINDGSSLHIKGCQEDVRINDWEDTYEISSLELGDFQKDSETNDYECINEDADIHQSSLEDNLGKYDDIIEVNDWAELQYYCYLNDKDYTLKLKDDTNFYPSSLNDSSCQIRVRNNVKIIGGKNSYIGDEKSYDTHPSGLPTYVPIVVDEEYMKVSLVLENVTFRWIKVWPGYSMEDGILIKIGGKNPSVFKNCLFQDMDMSYGHSCIVHLMKGTMTFDNCSFINCTNLYGCLSVYGSSPHMIVQNSYFENNYAGGEPGCINNCGKLTVYNTTFVKNRSKYWAGAIHTHSGANTTIYDSCFIDNLAGWNGGALYTYGYLQVYDSVFIGNNCTTDNGGGAIGACEYGSIPHIYVEGCYFKDNANNCWYSDEMSDGPGRGGAISLIDRGSLEVRNTTFISNVAARGSAICAWAAQNYGSPDVIIVNNSFINHTRLNDVLNVQIWEESFLNISDNYYYGNSIPFSNLTLTKLNEGKDQASFEIANTLSHPNWYDKDILDKTSYEVYINDDYVKTVDSTVFTIDFDDLDICNVYVVPTVSNRKSNNVTAVSTREYVFVSKGIGEDSNSGISRESPVNTISKALELARYCQNIILLDGDYSENLEIDYELTIKGEGNATLVNNTSFNVIADKFTLKNLNINNLISNSFIKANANLSISNCIFKDNQATLFNNTAFTNVTDSIFLNNSMISSNDNYDLDYNWWGNALENNAKPNDLNINIWLVLNASANTNELEVNQVAEVLFGFFLNNGVKYNCLHEISLELTAINGTSNKNFSSTESKVNFTLTALGNGELVFRYHNIQDVLNFTFLKSNPNISFTALNIMYGNDLIVKVNSPSDAAGNLTVSVFNQTKTLEITSTKTSFTFSDLKADNYVVTVLYSGNGKYLAQILNKTVNVAKYDSSTFIGLSPISVGGDLIITVNVNDDATGNIILYINNQMENLTLTDATASYTIGSIGRGDYIIRAVYNGDDKYLPSEDETKIEVGNINASMEISAENISYGQTAVINVKLNDDARGNVTVTVDNVSNTSEIINGNASVFLNGLDAGIDKKILVFYTGDDTYFNLTKNSSFTIDKANLTFNISSSDIMVGKIAVIKITVPKWTSGTFTIGGTTLGIPLSGEVEYLIRDLAVGNHTVTAVYEGNNYFTVSNSTSFSVMEYPSPQWANKGGTTGNTGKSPYESSVNGEILFMLPHDEKVNGIRIDSQGNVYITTNHGIYSYDDCGVFRWKYESSSVLGNFSESVIGRDVIVTPRSGDKVYFINQTSGEAFGSNLWQGSSLFSPVIDSNATVYTVSEYQVDSNSYKLVKILYRLWENGGDPIFMDLGNSAPIVSPVVSANIIAVLLESGLRVMDANTLQIKFIKSGNYSPVRPVIGEGDIIYLATTDSIIAYNSNGAQLWKTKVSGGVGSLLLLDSEHGLYASNANGNLYRYDLINGKGTLVSSLNITSGILIDQNSNLYFASGNFFYGMDYGGNLLWKSDLGSNITGTPVTDKKGIIYVSDCNNTVFALAQSELKDPIFNISVENDVLTVNYDNECVHGISFTLNGESYSVDNISVSDLPGGTYVLNVSYAGDLRFAKISKTFSVFLKYVSSIAILNESIENFSISLPDGAIGNVTVMLDGSLYEVMQLEGSKLSISFDLIAGNHQIFLIYSGDENYKGCNRTFDVYVPFKDANLEVSVPNIVQGENAVITIKINSQATGNVSFNLNDIYYSFETSMGTITKELPDLAVGNYIVDVRYPGDSRFKESAKSVLFSVKAITSPSVSISGSLANIALASDATGILILEFNGQIYAKELIGGKTSITLADGIYDAVISYSGDSKYIGFTKTVKIIVENSSQVNDVVENPDQGAKVVKKASKIVAKKKTFKAKAKTKKYAVSLKSGKTAIKKVKLTLKIKGKTYKATTNAKGKATFNIKKLTKKGKYTALIKFSGNKSYKASSKKVKIVLK